MKRIDWDGCDSAQRMMALARPAMDNDAAFDAGVQRIIDQVWADGDNSLRALTRRHDGVALGDLQVATETIDAATVQVDDDLIEALQRAAGALDQWHRQTLPQAFEVETAPGVRCGRIIRPIDTVGLYIPAGSAPLVSTVLMLGVPAMLAGCPRVVMCSPPAASGEIDPAILAAARIVGIEEIYRVGGAQAIAAMACGTQTVPRCDKLFGPGNRWVTRAKQLVAQRAAGVAIDMPAGPSELMVIADRAARADFVAADLLSQAEHGPDSQVLLVTPSAVFADAVEAEISRQLRLLPRADTARASLAHSSIVLVADLDTALAVANAYAPEHLILQVEAAERWLERVSSAGSVFLGPWSPEALGDYCSGTNHVLPTGSWARSLSGISVASFVKQISVQEATADGLLGMAAVAETLARREGLEAHRRAVAIRREALP